MRKFRFYFFILLSLLLVTSCGDNEDGNENIFNPSMPGIGDEDETGIDTNKMYGGWISELSTSENDYDDFLYSIYVNNDNTVEGYWYEGKDYFGVAEYSYFTGRVYLSGENLIITAKFEDEGEIEEETWDDITILKLNSTTLQIREGDADKGFTINYTRTSNIVPPTAVSKNDIYGEWIGKAPADDDEYMSSITVKEDNTISGKWYEGDGDYSQFSGTIHINGTDVVLVMIFYDENGDYDEVETWEDLKLAQLTNNTLVIRENGDEDEGEIFSYVNYCMYKPGGENLLPQPGDVYTFTSVVPVVDATNLTYVSNNRYKCSNSGGEYYLDIEAILTKLSGGTFRYGGEIGSFTAKPLGSNIFASVSWDMGYPNKYKINVDPNLSSYTRTQQIEIKYSYYTNQVSGTAIITIEQEAAQSSTGGNTGSGTGGSSTQIVTGTVNAVIDVIGPGLNYDSYAQYIDGKTDEIEYTYNPSTGEYYIYGGIYCSNPDANGGKGLRYKAQKGSNSIAIYYDYWEEYRPGSVVPIKYNWEARLKFTIP